MRSVLPFEVIVAHGDITYGEITLLGVESVMEKIQAPYRVRNVLDYGQLFDAMKGSVTTPIIISDPWSMPPIIPFQHMDPFEDLVTTVGSYLHASPDNQAILLFGEHEIDRMPQSKETFNRGFTGIESQYSVFREGESMLRRSTISALIMKVLQQKR
jgi:hypothetical protein